MTCPRVVFWNCIGHVTDQLHTDLTVHCFPQIDVGGHGMKEE